MPFVKRTLLVLALSALGLGGCTAEIPAPTMPVLTSQAQSEAARACQQHYTQCNGPCNSIIVWNGLEVNKVTTCHNACKQVLGDCYATTQHGGQP